MKAEHITKMTAHLLIVKTLQIPRTRQPTVFTIRKNVQPSSAHKDLQEFVSPEKCI